MAKVQNDKKDILLQLAGEAVQVLSQLHNLSTDLHPNGAQDIIPINTFFEHIGIPTLEKMHMSAGRDRMQTASIAPICPSSVTNLPPSAHAVMSPSTAHAAQSLLDLNR